MTLICLITFISQIAQLLLIRKCYCFRQGSYISFKYARHDHLPCLMMREYLSKRSFIKHTCSWRDKLIVLYVWVLICSSKLQHPRVKNLPKELPSTWKDLSMINVYLYRFRLKLIKLIFVTCDWGVFCASIILFIYLFVYCL